MKKFMFLIAGLANILAANAQKFEFGLQAGICNYWGDLAPRVQLSETKGTGGIFTRLNLSNTWALKAEFNMYNVSGTDKNFDFNADRNLSFTSNISEVATVIEFNYLKYGPFVLDKKMTSYVYVGIAGFTFNPKAKVDDKYYDLHDFQTEGVIYSTFSMAIPFGIGYKYMASKKLAFEAQLGFRKTFTDYLDDVSTVYPDMAMDRSLLATTLIDRSTELYGTPKHQSFHRRGNPDYKDWYMSMTVSVVMRLYRPIKCARFY